jgi:hypothetical protein
VFFGKLGDAEREFMSLRIEILDRKSRKDISGLGASFEKLVETGM